MKKLVEYIQEGLDKSVFDKQIKLGDEVMKKLEGSRVYWMHKDDSFMIKSSGEVIYSNQYLFTLPFKGKVKKTVLAKGPIPADDEKSFVLYPHVGGNTGGLDMKNPYLFIKAVLNAVIIGNYKQNGNTLILTDIDYTKEDLEKDKIENNKW